MPHGESVASSDRPWRFADPSGDGPASLSDVHASVRLPPTSAVWWRRLLAFVGPGYIISVGYMDPGNWATDIAGGSQFGYALLSVVMLSNLMAIILQALAARLGIATGRDLAQACRDSFPRSVNIGLWLACEAAIIACDLAEVIGTAIALQLLFGIPLLVGTVVTALDVFVVLMLMGRGFRVLEAFVAALLVVIAVCFAVQTIAAAPPIAAVLGGFIPGPRIVTDGAMLYLAISIVGATVMPHNLYLHSSIVQSRAYVRDEAGRREAIRWSTLDGTVALMLALFVNAAILIVAAAVFHAKGRHDVTEIGEAYRLLSPLLGVGIASTLFAIALLASGLNSTLTATLAGQIVMEGFLRLRLAPWARRLVTRGVSIVPVVAVVALYGERGASKLLVLSQVVLSMQLPFAIVPMVMFVSDRAKMGPFTIPRGIAVLAWAIAALILVLNGKVLIDWASGP